MHKLLVLLLGFLLVFYVGWPAWSIYRIYDALEENDVPTLRANDRFSERARFPQARH